VVAALAGSAAAAGSIMGAPGKDAAAAAGGRIRIRLSRTRASSGRMGCKRRQAMSDPLLRELDHYVVLEPGGADTILTAA
jgi:hypothetical protein